MRFTKTAGRSFWKVQRRLPYAMGCIMIATLSGCGNYVNMEAEGLSAVSRNQDGGYTFHVYSCDGYNVTGFTLVGGFYDGPSDTNNPPLGSFTKQEPSSGYSEINVEKPEGWKENEPLNLPTDNDKYILANFDLDNTGSGLPFATEHYVPGTSLSVGKLQELEVGTLVTDISDEELQTYASVEDFIAAGEAVCQR